MSDAASPNASLPPAADPSAEEIALHVDMDGTSRFRIAGAARELEQIGSLLRGRSTFSVMNSIIIPAMASILTALVISLFQYVSWLNSVRVQDARNTASSAEVTYKDAMKQLGQRGYESQYVADFMQELLSGGDWKANGLLESIYTFDQLRIATYYKAISDWNYAYDRMISDIAYKLDRPIFAQAFGQAGLDDAIKPISNTQTQSVDCSKPLAEQVAKIGYDKRSLKAQFAVIAQCYRAINARIDDLRDKALFDKNAKIEDKSIKEIRANLSDASTMANVFRCEFQHRLEFYNSEVEFGILSPATIYRLMTNGRAKRAMNHFESTDDDCAR
jgi:hypothetical protein